jgi:hypothetical protein
MKPASLSGGDDAQVWMYALTVVSLSQRLYRCRLFFFFFLQTSRIPPVIAGLLWV